MGISKTETNSLIDVLNDGSCKFGGLSRAECPPADRLWRIVLLKVTYYATSSAPKLWHNSQIMLLIFEIMLTK